MSDDWVSARYVVEVAQATYGHEERATHAIARRAANGALRSRAKVLTEDRTHTVAERHVRDVELSRRFWQIYLECLEDPGSVAREDWLIGDFALRRVYSNHDGIDPDYHELVASGVEFWRDEVPSEWLNPAPACASPNHGETNDVGDHRTGGKQPGGKHTPAWAVAATVGHKLASRSPEELRQEKNASVGALIEAEFIRMGLTVPHSSNLERWGGEILRAVSSAAESARKDADSAGV